MIPTTPATNRNPNDALAAHYGRIGISAVASMTTFLAESRDQAAKAVNTAPVSAKSGQAA